MPICGYLRWLWLACIFNWFDAIEGHGYVTSPRSRNWVAYEDGIEGEQAGVPRREYCSHCLNRNSGACGNSPTYNYDEWIDSTNVPMPWKSEGTYVGGSTIRVRTYLTTHHGGHMEVRACPNGRESTWDCFEDIKNRLTFVKDYLYDVPADPKYPERGYYAGYDKQVQEFDMEFKLPDALVGEEVLLEWRYITANSCSPPGYEDYFNGANSQSKVLPEGWYGKTLQPCVLPYPSDGSVGGAGAPEQFFNCMEVTILPPPPSVSRTPTLAPSLPSPTTPTTTTTIDRTSAKQDSRMVAYLSNWLSCPTAQQLQQYSHIVVAFAVTYTPNASKNICSSTCQISTPPICNNGPNTELIQQLQQEGKKVMLSFGGAGMGGSWDGDVNDCWEACFGRQDEVVTTLVRIVTDMNLDGVDIDYEYFYEDNQNGSGFKKGSQAIKFLHNVTVGLRNQLPIGSLLSHVPMDSDLMPGTAYYELLKSISYTLDFIMPQYYNGITRPVIDGFGGANEGRVSAASHYKRLVDNLFNGDATKVVFGFCISDCSSKNSNANATQAAAVMKEVGDAYKCHGGAFFWVAQDDPTGSWAAAVNRAMDPNRGCSGGVDPVGKSSTKIPVDPSSTRNPVGGGGGSGIRCCPDGYSGNRAFDGCKSFYQCVSGKIVGGESVTTCPPDTLFDAKLDTCNWAYAVKNCVVDPCETLAPTPSPIAPSAPTRRPVGEMATPLKKRPPQEGADGNKDASKLFNDEGGILTARHALRMIRGL